jgi:hypothetical protein
MKSKSTDNVRVLFWVTFSGAITFQVVDERCCVLAQVAKVYGLAAFPQKKQPVEYLQMRL